MKSGITCQEVIQSHLDKARATTPDSMFARAWSCPGQPCEKALRDSIRGWAGALDTYPGMLSTEFGRYLKAQGLALRAWVTYGLDTGRLDARKVLALVTAIGEAGGINWLELAEYNDD